MYYTQDSIKRAGQTLCVVEDTIDNAAEVDIVCSIRPAAEPNRNKTPPRVAAHLAAAFRLHTAIFQ